MQIDQIAGRAKQVLLLGSCALLLGACGSFEIGIEHVPPGGNVSVVNGTAAPDALQPQSAPTLVPTAIPLTVPGVVPTLAPMLGSPVTVGTDARVAYVQGGDVWVMTLPDGEPQRLTHDGRNQEPKWSPSGLWISFLKNPEYPVLWVMRADGSQAQQLAAAQVDSYAWSPVEDEIAVGDGGSVQVYAPADRREATLISQTQIGTPASDAIVDHLAWRPDGQEIAFTLMAQMADGDSSEINRANDGLWVVGAEGGSPTQVLTSEVPEKGPFVLWGWSADGQDLIYWQAPILSASILADGVPLYRVKVADGSVEMLVEAALVHDGILQFQPNNAAQGIVVEGGGREMWRNKQLRPLFVNPGQADVLSPADQAVSSPVWSPSGDAWAWIAMPVVTEDGDGEAVQTALQARRLWVMYDGNEAMPALSESIYREEGPQWVDDTHVVVVRMDDAGQASLWLIGLAPVSEKLLVDELTPAPDAFGYYGYIDWSPFFAVWRPVAMANDAVQTSTHMPTAVPQQVDALARFLDNLHPNLTPDEAIALWGQPAAIVGSGLQIYQYPVTSQVSLWLGFPGNGPLTYAQLHTVGGSVYLLNPVDWVPAEAESVMTPTPAPASEGAAEPTAVPPISMNATPTPTAAGQQVPSGEATPTVEPTVVP